MTDNHPITPPPELIEDWIELAKPLPQRPPNPGELATFASRWGSDQELEACCKYISGEGKWFVNPGYRLAQLRAARRPRPLSLKDQALNELDLTADPNGAELSRTQVELIRRALEQLND